MSDMPDGMGQVSDEKGMPDLILQIEEHLRTLDHSGPTLALTTAIEVMRRADLHAAEIEKVRQQYSAAMDLLDGKLAKERERAERCGRALALIGGQFLDCEHLPGCIHEVVHAALAAEEEKG